MALPLPPAPKIWYESLGTLLYQERAATGAFAFLNASNLAPLNNEGDDGFLTNVDFRLGFIFPQQYDIVALYPGWFTTSSGGRLATVRTSVDSTAGTDGTWVTRSTNLAGGIDGYMFDSPYIQNTYRRSIVTVNWANVKAITFAFPANEFFTEGIHFYGNMSVAETDYLQFWDPTAPVVATPGQLDFGDIKRGGTGTRQFRIRNASPSKVATSITVTSDALTPSNPTLLNTTLFSSDGSTFARSINIGNLAAGAVSGVLHCRMTVPTTVAFLLPWRQRCRAIAATFT